MIKVNHLYVAFTKEFYTLNDISFEMQPGDKMVIVGGKESGRTAMLRTLVGLESIAKGEIFYKNISIDKVDFENDISLGYLPDMPSFLENKSVKQNIEYVLKIRKNDPVFMNAKVNNALVGYGLDFIKNKKCRELSIYERIRVAIARLSVRNLDVLFVDDIFTRLSEDEKKRVVKMLKELIKMNNATAIIMVESEDIAKAFGYNKKYLNYGTLTEEENHEFD